MMKLSKKRKLQELAISLLALVLLLAGCGDDMPTPANLSAATATATIKLPESPALNWLRTIPCRAPCWEGITPGQTTGKEALEILKKHPKISNPNLFAKGITWAWVDNDAGEGEMLFDDKASKQVIYWIRPYIKVKFKLADVFQQYGEPDYIIALKVEPSPVSKITYYNVLLIYVNQGFSVSGIFYDKSGFNENLMLEKFELFIPNEATVRKLFNNTFQQNAVRWEGFKDFDLYRKTNPN